MSSVPQPPSTASGLAPASAYARRRPELGTLHRIVRENLATFYAAVEQGFATAALPDFVKHELESYLDCG